MTVAILEAFDKVSAFFTERDLDVDFQLGWRELERRVTKPRCVWVPGDAAAMGDFAFVGGTRPGNLGALWTAVSIHCTATAAPDDERAQIRETTLLAHQVLIALQAIGAAAWQFSRADWTIDVARRANATIVLTVVLRDDIVDSVPRFTTTQATGVLTVEGPTERDIQHDVPTD
jgi:hypothetical protein